MKDLKDRIKEDQIEERNDFWRIRFIKLAILILAGLIAVAFAIILVALQRSNSGYNSN